MKLKTQTRKTLLTRKTVVKRNKEAANVEVITVVTSTEVATNIKTATKIAIETSTVRVDLIIKAANQKIKTILPVQKRTANQKTLKDLTVLQIKTGTIRIIKTVNKIRKLTLRVN